MDTKFLSKPIPFLTRFFLFLFVVLVGYAIIAQTILIPRAISNQYDKYLRPDFQQLSVKFNAVSKSTELPAFNDPYSDVRKGRDDLLATQQLIAETEQALQEYESQAAELPTSPFARFSESYKKAQLVRTRANDIFLQSREVLDGFKGQVAYLLEINRARTVLTNSTADINGLINLNQLAGQGDVVARRADQLGSTIATMKNAKVPAGYEVYHAALIANFEQSQAGLEQLSQGLFAAVDANINSGAKVMEQAIRSIEDSASLYTTASKQSVILKETSMISDKIDSLQPFLE